MYPVQNALTPLLLGNYQALHRRAFEILQNFGNLRRKECDAAAAAGALSFRLVAFSRDPHHPKQYVQDKLRQVRNGGPPILGPG
jgi:hypothetical protein